jgi:hypothetical protein
MEVSEVMTMPDISGAGRFRDHAGRLAACLFISMTVSLLQPGCGRYAGMAGGQEKESGTSEQIESTGIATDTHAGDSAGHVEATTETAAAKNSGGLTSVEASELVWPKAKANFKDAVLWRMAPVNARESTKMMLDADWQDSDRSAAWFIWYADPVGDNWLMFTIEGRKQTGIDIGTRSFSMLEGVPSEWPRERAAVTMKEAAAKAAAQGANLEELTWVELNCAYAGADVQGKPVWVFSCSETTNSGGALNYRIFIDAISGDVVGAVNERNESMTLPINLDALEKPRAEDHRKDVETFFSFIAKGDPIWSVRQLSYAMAPDEATGQAWMNSFQSLKSLEVVSIEQARLEEWTSEWETYKVTLDAATDDPPEKYGWENGRNIRWVTIVPQGAGAWKVDALASNP